MSELRKVAAFASLLAGFVLSTPAVADVVKLQSLEQQALRQHSGIAVESAKSRAALTRIELARASTNPTLTFLSDGTLGPSNALVRVRDVTGTEYWVQGSRDFGTEGALLPQLRYGITLAFQGKLYDFGRTADAIRAARSGARAGDAEADAKRAQILHDVREAYLAWTLARASLDIAEQTAREAQARREATEGRVEEGTRPNSDLPVARADEARAQLALVQARGRAGAARLVLESAAEIQLPENADPDPAVLDIAPPRSLLAAPPGLVALERRRDAARAEADSHGHSFAPVLSGLVQSGIMGQAEHVFPAYRVGLSLAVPLWDGGTESAARGIAEAEADQLAALSKQSERALASERAMAQADYASALERVHASETLRDAAGEVLSGAEERYKLGVGTPEAVIEARSSFTRALLEVLLARGARSEAVLRLLDAAAFAPSATSRAASP